MPVDRYLSTIAIIAAVHLARLPDVDLSITKVGDTAKKSVLLARTILDEVRRLM